MGHLVSIVYRPRDAESSAEAYTRVPLQNTELVAGFGIAGDAKGGGPERHLNIMSQETLQQLGAEGFSVEPGRMGEQLILSGLDVNALPAGARIRIGQTACVMVGIPRTGCGKFERNQGKLKQEAAGRLGMMARVDVGGLIAVGDPVAVLSE